MTELTNKDILLYYNLCVQIKERLNSKREEKKSEIKRTQLQLMVAKNKNNF